jgi:hypothetical protein
LTDGPAATLASRIVSTTASFAKSLVGTITAYVVGLTAAALALHKLEEALPGYPEWLPGVIIFCPIILALALHTLPELLAARRRERLKEITGSLKPGYFSLAPRDDEASFQRADGKHNETLQWLERSAGRVLYLTGFSGSGKSSLLKAWVLPRLQRQETRIITLRGYQDPVALLRKELRKPGVIWQKPPDGEQQTLELLKRASRHISPDKLLVVFDQFEECLILQDPARIQPLVQLLSSLAAERIPNATFVLVLRTDYTGQLGELNLPRLTQDDNWKEIPPFTERAAQEFVQGSGLSVSDELLRGVLREAAEIEQTKGLIRPITINLCGLVLGRFANGVPRGFRPGALIRGFLQESVMLPSVREVAPRLLPWLITPSVTKVPRTITDLAESSGQERAVVRGCLLTLGQADRAIVRPLDSQQETWEISHDFLVPLLDSIVARSSVSPWGRVRPYFPWLAAAALVLALGLGWHAVSSRLPEVPHFGKLGNESTSDDPFFKRQVDLGPKPIPVSRGGEEPVLNLSGVLGPAGLDMMKGIEKNGKIVFHAVGSTAYARRPKEEGYLKEESNSKEEIDRQLGPPRVADKMDNDFREGARKPHPSFLFHLGDVICGSGESQYYYGQFYLPYKQYPGPILAIAGNHDGMPAPESKATPLQPFLDNFCAEGFHQTSESRGLGRTAQVQPGVYYTLEAPFLRILALYSNRLEGSGVISSEGGRFPDATDVQLRFLEAALERVKAQGFKGAVIIAVHHDPYSPSQHRGSPGMRADLDRVFRATGVWPHAVLSGHAHNYQRYTRTVDNVRIPYVVAGNGGAGVTRLTDAGTPKGKRLPLAGDDVTFEASDDEHLGFLRVTVDQARLQIEYQPIENPSSSSRATPDSVTIDLKSRQVVTHEEGR